MGGLAAYALAACPLAALSIAAPLPALGDDALGTLTVKGKTTVLRHVVATEEKDPDDPSGKWLVALLSDRPVAPADRAPERLRELAADGKLKALRVLWHVGFDSVRAVPYHAALPASGRLGIERPTLNLTRYDGKRVDAEVRSKMVGQDWHFQVRLKADVSPGGTLKLEAEATEEELMAGAGGTPGANDATRKKIALGKLGYEATPDMFTHAVSDGNLEAVRLFLEIGTSPNTKDESGNHPMILAAQACSNPRADLATRSAVLEALVAAKGDVKAADENGSTPLLWAVQTGCQLNAIQTLLKAGADPNARAKGGATPLMMAEVFQRADVAEVLRKAGARKPK